MPRVRLSRAVGIAFLVSLVLLPVQCLGLTSPAVGVAAQPLAAPPAGMAAYLRQLYETPAAALVAYRGPTLGYGTGVAWLAYAHWARSFFVAAPPTSLDVFPQTNLTAPSVIPVGNAPFGVAVDEVTSQVFVTNSGSDNVTVINGTTLKVEANLAVQKEPLGIVLDELNGTIYVANNGSGTVSVISVPSLTVLTNISVGSQPTGLAWDKGTNRVFVTDRGSNDVAVISGATHKLLAYIGVGLRPFGIADDNETGRLYIANEGSFNVSVVSANLAGVIATVPVAGAAFYPDLQGVGYDSAHQKVWVTAGRTIVIIDASTNYANSEVGYDPAGVAYDPDNGDVCVTNSANITFGCFSFGPSSVIREANVTFSETGLPSGTRWNITLSGANSVTQESWNSSIRFGADLHWAPWGYSYAFAVAAAGGYAANVTLGIVGSSSGGDTKVFLDFSRNGSFLVSFSPAWIQANPADMTWWAVTLNGTTVTSYATMRSIRFAEPNGTYPFTISWSASYPSSFMSTPGAGIVVLDGAASYVTIWWTSRGDYPVEFTQAGLPRFAAWSVDLEGIALTVEDGGPAWFAVANGTGYAFTVGDSVGAFPTPASGTIAVNGKSIRITIAFSPSPPPIGIRAWANVTAEAGGGYYCIDGTGEIGTHPAWENVSFAAVAWNGSPPYKFNWSFGDGPFLVLGEQVTHTYGGFGIWHANLSVVDAAGATNSTHFVIRNLAPPGPPLICPRSPSTNATFLGFPTLEGYAVVAGIGVTIVVAAVALVIWSKGRTPPPVG